VSVPQHRQDVAVRAEALHHAASGYRPATAESRHQDLGDADRERGQDAGRSDGDTDRLEKRGAAVNGVARPTMTIKPTTAQSGATSTANLMLDTGPP
jgi:hypothetical protein